MIDLLLSLPLIHSGALEAPQPILLAALASQDEAERPGSLVPS